jgi:hypothetical protein
MTPARSDRCRVRRATATAANHHRCCFAITSLARKEEARCEIPAYVPQTLQRLNPPKSGSPRRPATRGRHHQGATVLNSACDTAAQMPKSGRLSQRRQSLFKDAAALGLGTAVVKPRKVVRFALTEAEENTARLAGSWMGRMEELLRRTHSLLVQVHAAAIPVPMQLPTATLNPTDLPTQWTLWGVCVCWPVGARDAHPRQLYTELPLPVYGADAHAG